MTVFFLAKLPREQKNCTIARKTLRKESICDDRKIKKASLFATFFRTAVDPVKSGMTRKRQTCLKPEAAVFSRKFKLWLVYCFEDKKFTQKGKVK